MGLSKGDQRRVKHMDKHSESKGYWTVSFASLFIEQPAQFVKSDAFFPVPSGIL